jgi:hypothetical protein
MFLSRSVRNFALCCSSIPFLFAGTCPPSAPSQPPVTIAFEQVGACNGYPQTFGPGGSGPHAAVNAGFHAAFVIFRILKVDNSKGAADFNFDPERIFIAERPSEHVDTGLSVAADFGLLKSVAITVPKGGERGHRGFAVVTVSTAASNGASEANNTNYLLSYNGAPSDPPVFLAKKNLSQTTFKQTDNCLEITFP